MRLPRILWPAPALTGCVGADSQMQLHIAVVAMSDSAVHDPAFVATSHALSKCGDNVCSVLDKLIAVMMLQETGITSLGLTTFWALATIFMPIKYAYKPNQTYMPSFVMSNICASAYVCFPQCAVRLDGSCRLLTQQEMGQLGV